MTSQQQVHPERQKRVSTALTFFTVAATITGIFLVMHYKPDAERAFQSVEYIMREVPGGWLIRYMHSTGASMFFVVVYLLSILNLAPKARWSVGKWFTTALAGVIPFFSFWMEIKRRNEVKQMFQLS